MCTGAREQLLARLADYEAHPPSELDHMREHEHRERQSLRPSNEFDRWQVVSATAATTASRDGAVMNGGGGGSSTSQGVVASGNEVCFFFFFF